MLSSFKEGEIVWAKIKGYSWWPAKVRIFTHIKIIEIKETKQETFVLVAFIGDSTHATVQSNCIKKYKEYYQKFAKTKKKYLLNSIMEANQLLDWDGVVEGLSENLSSTEKNESEIIKIEIAQTDEDTKEEKNDSIGEEDNKEESNIIINRKTKREENEIKEKSPKISKEELFNKITKYFIYISNLIKKKKNYIDKEKQCLSKVFDFLLRSTIKDMKQFLKKTNIGKMITFFIINIKNDDEYLYEKAKLLYNKIQAQLMYELSIANKKYSIETN